MERLIDEESREELRKRFESEMKRKIELLVFVDPNDNEHKEYSDFTVQISRELAELTDKINVRVYEKGSPECEKYGVSRFPTVLIDPDSGYRIRYTGAPAGQEGWGFVETIILVSRDESTLSPVSEEKLKSLNKNVKIQVYVTPSCPYCPMSVVLANKIAIAAKGKVESECVEAIENQDLAGLYNVSAVPQQVINDGAIVSIGAQPEDKFVDDVLKA